MTRSSPSSREPPQARTLHNPLVRPRSQTQASQWPDNAKAALDLKPVVLGLHQQMQAKKHQRHSLNKVGVTRHLPYTLLHGAAHVRESTGQS